MQDGMGWDGMGKLRKVLSSRTGTGTMTVDDNG